MCNRSLLFALWEIIYHVHSSKWDSFRKSVSLNSRNYDIDFNKAGRGTPPPEEYFKVLFKHKVSRETTQLREQFIAHIKVSRPLMNDVICIYCLVDPIIASSFLDCYVCSFPPDLLGLEENWKHCYAVRKLLFSSEKREFYC